jgi:hypothetical protein
VLYYHVIEWRKSRKAIARITRRNIVTWTCHVECNWALGARGTMKRTWWWDRRKEERKKAKKSREKRKLFGLWGAGWDECRGVCRGLHSNALAEGKEDRKSADRWAQYSRCPVPRTTLPDLEEKCFLYLRPRIAYLTVTNRNQEEEDSRN